MEKQDLRSLTSGEKIALRKTAIRMLKQGLKKGVLAQQLGVNKNTITTWVKTYELYGAKSYKYDKRGVKSGERKYLSIQQEEAIQSMILDKMPDQLKLPYGLWTRKAVKELISREFNINLAINTVGDYLRSWDYSPQKPKKRAYEQCPKKVQKWLEEQYPTIKEQAKKENAEIHWGDETGIKNSCQHGRSYAPKGQTPVKKNKSKRFTVNMISTVTNQGKVRFMTYSGSMNAERFIKFIAQLIKDIGQKIYLILDNLRVHHSKIVKEWVEKNAEKIKLFFLPSYAPEKNPDEYLNCDLKYGMSELPSPKTEEKLKENIENHMRMLQENEHRVIKYFSHKDIKYAA